MEYLFQTEIQGGLIISTKKWFDSFSENLAFSLNIVLDVDGLTEIKYDYLNQDWKEVWRKEAKNFLELCKSGSAAIIVLRENTYKLKVNFNSSFSSSLVHFANLKVEDTKIYVAEAGYFLKTYFSDENFDDFQTISIASGFYEIY